MPDYAPIKSNSLRRIKTMFVSAILRESAEMIQQQQEKVADDWDLFETGTLKASLQGHFTVSALDEATSLSMRYLTYARFLDLPDNRRASRQLKREGYHLYNRVMFGVLYKRSYQAIASGYTADLRDTVAQVLTDTFEGDEQIKALFVKDLRRGYFDR